MDDDLKQLEAELRTLRPASPSRALEQRIANELKPSASGRLSHWGWLWVGALPAAAAVAVAVAVMMRRDVGVPARGGAEQVVASRGTLKPVAAENVLYEARDEGLVVLDDGTAGRRERLNYLDTFTWKDPRSNASLKWTVPREEVRFVPVNFQ